MQNTAAIQGARILPQEGFLCGETTYNPNLSLLPTTKAYLHSGARGTLGRKFVWSLPSREGVVGLRQKLRVTGASGWSAGVERILRQIANSQ